MIIRARETDRRRFLRVERSAKLKQAVRYPQSTCGLVAMTSASHAEGRQFDPGQVYGSWQNMSVIGRARYLCQNSTRASLHRKWALARALNICLGEADAGSVGNSCRDSAASRLRLAVVLPRLLRNSQNGMGASSKTANGKAAIRKRLACRFQRVLGTACGGAPELRAVRHLRFSVGTVTGWLTWRIGNQRGAAWQGCASPLRCFGELGSQRALLIY